MWRSEFRVPASAKAWRSEDGSASAAGCWSAAEAAGLRGTGIGCYFDDVLHQALGLQDLTYQSLYHFTLGGPREDRRLLTLPPY